MSSAGRTLTGALPAPAPAASLRRADAAGAAAMVVGVPLVITLLDRPSYMTAAVYALVLAVAALSLVVLLGYTGQLSLAQFGFMGIGALAVAHLAPYTGYWAAVPLAGLATVPVGLVAALPALRLRGIYLAVATLIFGEVVSATVLQNTTLVPDGVLHVGVPSLGFVDFPATLAGRRSLYLVDLAIVAALAGFLVALRPRRTGLAFVAVRDSERAAASVGIDVVACKLRAFGLSAFYAGIAGAMYMGLSLDASPRYFDGLTGSIPLLIVVAIGGVASVRGALIAGFLFAMGPLILPQMLTWALDQAHLHVTVGADLVLALFGVLLLRTLVSAPDGLAGLLDRTRGDSAAPAGPDATRRGAR